MLENIKNQLISLVFVGLVFLLATMLFLFLTDPFKLSLLVLILFYLCLAVFLFSLFTLLLYSLRKNSDVGLHYQKMLVSMRQAGWLALLVVGLLVLASMQLLYWWLGLVFILALAMIEGFFLSSN